QHAAPPGGNPARAGDLPARPGRPVVPAGEPRRPHPRGVLRSTRSMLKQVTLRREDGEVVCDDCVVADSPVSRMKGLLGRKELKPGEGLLLRPAGSIHTFFMRF